MTQLDMFGDYAGRYRLIYADPPWRYDNFGLKGHGAVRAHYPTMTIGQMMRLPVRALAHPEGCALVMWATCTTVAEGRHAKLMRAWGFRPVTELFRWRKVYDRCRCGHAKDSHRKGRDPTGRPLGSPCSKRHRNGTACYCQDFVAKPRCGLGFYTRSSGESAFLGLRGSMPGAVHDVYQEIEAPVIGHSVKPDEVYDRMARLWPDLPHGSRLELFSRRAREGWDAWGNQAPGSVDVFKGLMDPETIKLADAEADVDALVSWLAERCTHDPPCAAVAPRARCAKAWLEHVEQQRQFFPFTAKLPQVAEG